MIKFVYFDLGGVVIKDFSGTNSWNELKKEIGIKSRDYKEFDNFWDKHLEVNTIKEVDTLKLLIEKKFGVKFPEKYSLLIDGFVSRFDLNKSIWPVVDEIQKFSRIGLLTNMYPGMFEAIKKKNLLPNNHWDNIVDSSVIALQKPDSEIYAYAEKVCGNSGSEILFIDNTIENIVTPKQFGWQTFLYDSSDPVLSSNNLLEYFHQLKNEK